MIQLDFRRRIKKSYSDFQCYSESDSTQKPPTTCDSDSAILVRTFKNYRKICDCTLRAFMQVICSNRIENEVPRMKFDMLVGVSTSYYSKKITMNHGFIVAEEMKYADYRDPITNEAVFSNIPAPHTGAAVVYKYISTSKYWTS